MSAGLVFRIGEEEASGHTEMQLEVRIVFHRRGLRTGGRDEGEEKAFPMGSAVGESPAGEGRFDFRSGGIPINTSAWVAVHRDDTLGEAWFPDAAG